jgi:formylglycine-generating enzyme required for sulfatase activity
MSTNKRLLYTLLACALFSAAIPAHAEEDNNAGLVYIESGEYSGRVGYPDITYKSIYIDSFFIDKFEVSVSDYAQCITSGTCDKTALIQYIENSVQYNTVPLEDALAMAQQDKRPMTYVTFEDSAAYCAYAGKRLPTVAEWEKAAGADPEKRKYPWGNEPPDCTKANIKPCMDGAVDVDTTAYPPSIYGVYNMIGNVQERTLDIYHTNFNMIKVLRNSLCTKTIYDTLPLNKESLFSKRRMKGGSFEIVKDFIGSYVGMIIFDEARIEDVGFRCVKSKLMAPEDFNK